MNETITDTHTVYQGRIFDVQVHTVQFPDGARSIREIVQHKGAAAVVPLDDVGNILMVRQFRLAAGRPMLEIPAGGLSGTDEPPRDCAIRELQEEIGHKPRELIDLGSFYVAPGYSTERIYLFLGRQLTPSRLEMDHDERIAVVRMPFDEVLAMVYDGRIMDSKTIIAVVRAARYLEAEEAGRAQRGR